MEEEELRLNERPSLQLLAFDADIRLREEAIKHGKHLENLQDRVDINDDLLEMTQSDVEVRSGRGVDLH